jgi:hypothetical protein
MRNPKLAFLVVIALAAGTAWAAQQQAAPTSPPASTPAAPAAGSTNVPNDVDETATLIARANAAAAANANARAASMSTRTLTQVEASRESRKKAGEFGFRAEVYNGSTLFCKHDAALGSRIPLVRCMSAQEFDEYSTQMKIARDSIENNLETQCQGKFTCGGIKMGQTGNANN